MNSVLKRAFFAAALAALAAPAYPQSASPAPTIEQRKENQQDRIANGVASGELTATETKNLEKKEAALNHEERDMRKLDNGKLTAADRATLNQQQNQLSKQIYHQKHDASVQSPNPTSEVKKREENQQDRIAQGIKSGQLTAGEASHLEKREAAINKEIKADRAANGGTLTPAERRKVNRQENRTSAAIYRKKHN